MDRTSTGGLAALFACAFLTACGGGSGSPAPSPAPGPAPLPSGATITSVPRVDVGATLQITTSVADTDGLTFSWDYGDGTQGLGPTPQHVYAAGGTYHVVLTISNAADQSEQLSQDVQAGWYSNVRGLLCTGAESTGWCWQDDRVTGHPILSADFMPFVPKAFASGGYGTILGSQDDGDTWTLFRTGSTDSILAVQFLNPAIGIGLTDAGAVLYTKDGGADWTAAPIPGAVPDPSATLAAFDASQLVVNDADQAYVTHDNGRTWSTVPLGHVTVVGMDCWSLGDSVKVSANCTHAPEKRAVGGPAGVTYRAMSSTNGGQNITILGDNPTDHTVETYVSGDGGATWSARATPLTVPDSLTVRGINVQETVILLDQAVVVTTDGGATFSYAAPTDAPQASLAGLQESGAPFYLWDSTLALASTDDPTAFVEIPSPEPGTAYGPGYLHDVHVYRWDGAAHVALSIDGRFYVTHDAGGTWTQALGADARDTNAATGRPRGFALGFFDAAHGTLVTSAGAVESTGDGGRTWTRQMKSLSRSQGTDLPVAVHYTSATTAWLVMDDSLWQTTDGGATWAHAAGATAFTQVTAMAWPDAQHGWIANGSRLEVTVDGGTSWTDVAVGTPFDPVHDRVDDVAFPNASTGIVRIDHFDAANSDEEVLYLRTADGGATWTVAAGPFGPSSRTLLGGSKTFWLSTGDGRLLRSADAGATWTDATPAIGAATTFLPLSASDDAHAWIEADGRLMATADGGATWRDTHVPTDVTVAAGIAVDAGTVWLATDAGTVLATATGGQ